MLNQYGVVSTSRLALVYPGCKGITQGIDSLSCGKINDNAAFAVDGGRRRSPWGKQTAQNRKMPCECGKRHDRYWKYDTELCNIATVY